MKLVVPPELSDLAFSVHPGKGMISEHKLGAVAGELTWRLHQRNSTIQPRHDFPKLLVSTSSEALRVANDVRTQLKSATLSTMLDGRRAKF